MNNGRPRLSWEETALKLAFDIAKYRSEDPFVQCGAVIIKNDHSILLGYNGSPAGSNIDWSNRDRRRKRVLHAEQNVLDGVEYGEVKIFAVTALPCERCILEIANKGIKTVYFSDFLENYDKNTTFELAKEFGIQLIRIEKDK